MHNTISSWCFTLSPHDTWSMNVLVPHTYMYRHICMSKNIFIQTLSFGIMRICCTNFRFPHLTGRQESDWDKQIPQSNPNPMIGVICIQIYKIIEIVFHYATNYQSNSAFKMKINCNFFFSLAPLINDCFFLKGISWSWWSPWCQWTSWTSWTCLYHSCMYIFDSSSW